MPPDPTERQAKKQRPGGEAGSVLRAGLTTEPRAQSGSGKNTKVSEASACSWKVGPTQKGVRPALGRTQAARATVTTTGRKAYGPPELEGI